MKPFLYFVGAIFLAACVYAFIQYVPISYEVGSQQSQIVDEQGSAETEGPLKKAIDKNSTVLCEIESFWSKYNVWGDTDTVYGPAENDETADNKVDENIRCDEPLENSVSQ